MTAPMGENPAKLRLGVLAVVVISLFGTLLVRLWFLQVVNASKAQLAVSSNAIRTAYLPAPRGEILDRNGNVIVGNQLTEVVTLNRDTAKANPTMISNLAALLGTTSEAIMAKVNDNRYEPYQPVPVAQSVPNTTVLNLEEHAADYPGVQVGQGSLRTYPYGDSAANIVGYVNEITGAELAKLKADGYQSGDQVGQAGIEAEYERYLRGTPGKEKLQVDSQGNVLGVVGYTAPVPGDNIRLSIDMHLQQTAEQTISAQLLAARTGPVDKVSGQHFAAPAGSAVVVDPQTFHILALATVPRYNPADFVGGISVAKYKALQSQPGNPLLDRSVQGQYSPGSTFKLVTATAALNAGLITPYTYYNDTGSIKVGPETFTNDNGASYGEVDLENAIKVSSDAYFYQLGANFWNDKSTLGPTALQNVAQAYGFGNYSGVDLPDGAPGNIPTPALLAKEYDQNPKYVGYKYWTTGDSVQTAIGQYQVEVTPLQLADAYATFANGGTLRSPRLALDAELADGQVVAAFIAPIKGHATVSADNHAAILRGFEEVVADPKGTAYLTFQGFPLNQLQIAGKTGTAQVKNGQSTSVFTSFGPATNPQYVVDSFMEQSGYGATIAGAVSRALWQQILTETQQGTLSLPPVPTVGQAEPTTTTTTIPPLPGPSSPGSTSITAGGAGSATTVTGTPTDTTTPGTATTTPATGTTGTAAPTTGTKG